jgi:folate-binding protein YgfZ
MCSLTWVLKQEQSWVIDADLAVLSPLKARLERYIVSDDVQIMDISDTGMLFHIFGKAASHACHGQSNILASRLGLPGIDIWVPSTQIDVFHQRLTQSGILEATTELSEPFRIAQGIPMWGSEISEKTFPAEAGLDQLAIDFAKGCYVGQEVVSRIRSIGHVNQLLVGFVSEGFGTVLPPDSKILDPNSNQCVGTLTSAAFHFELGRVVALGYLKSGIALSDKTDFLLAFHLESMQRVPLRRREFPFLDNP